MSTRGFLIEILLHIYNVQQTSNLRLFIHFYYLQIVRKLSELLRFPDTYSKFFFNDVTTLQVIKQNRERNFVKHETNILCKIS